LIQQSPGVGQRRPYKIPSLAARGQLRFFFADTVIGSYILTSVF